MACEGDVCEGRVCEGGGGACVCVCVCVCDNAPDFVVSLSELAMVVVAKHVHLTRVEEDGYGERGGSREVCLMS